MNNPVTRMLSSIGATALMFIILGAAGIDLPLWAAMLTGFLIGIVLGIGDMVAKRRRARQR
ncbi:hypothetical protein SEA_ABT2GRADUATEX2_64 [Streptomyces phage Abt2graduatex2]|nr:hypothetical protein SEA_ABT2GRADUATEX2_64 [Streptomyces phage Abt2graduatex2]